MLLYNPLTDIKLRTAALTEFCLQTKDVVSLCSLTDVKTNPLTLSPVRADDGAEEEEAEDGIC